MCGCGHDCELPDLCPQQVSTPFQVLLRQGDRTLHHCDDDVL